MPQYLLRGSLNHLSFRIPSILAVGDTYGFPIKFISSDLDRGVIVVELEKEEHVQRILDRGTLVLWAVELYAEGRTYDELHAALQGRLDELERYAEDSFRISIEAANLHLSGARLREIATSFPYIPMRGRVDLENAQTEFVVFEDYDWKPANTSSQRSNREGQFERTYFGRRIGHSRIRPIIKNYAIKTREYYGNTSMEAEMGFLMAGQTLSAPGKIVYDPFAGTGSLLYACAEMGSYVFGSDIDGRQMRGKNKGKGVVSGIMRAATQYGVADKILDCMTYDVTKHPLRRGGWIDAIIADPPYGVRAGAKRLGKRESKGRPTLDEPYILPDGTLAHEKPGYLPPSRPYELAHLTLDLIRLARYLLVPRGRLVFFLPTVTEEYDAIDIPVVDGMRDIKWGEGSVQDFGKWGRRLITMEKTAEDDGEAPGFDDYSQLEGHTAAHTDFSRRYFAGFVPRKTDQENEPILSS